MRIWFKQRYIPGLSLQSPLKNWETMFQQSIGVIAATRIGVNPIHRHEPVQQA
jgi:hypothetical protein